MYSKAEGNETLYERTTATGSERSIRGKVNCTFSTVQTVLPRTSSYTLKYRARLLLLSSLARREGDIGVQPAGLKKG